MADFASGPHTETPGESKAAEDEDARLVAAMAAGDRAAMARLYDRHSPSLTGLAFRIVRNHETAEDLLHDVFLEAWRAAKDYDPARAKVRTWLAIRLRSRALDVMKSPRVARRVDNFALDQLEDLSEVASPDCIWIRGALACLSANQRLAIELTYFDGLSRAEVAELMGCPLGTARSRIASGMERLRLELAAVHADD